MNKTLSKTYNSLSKTYFNIYLVRHGETDENKTGIIQGQRNTQLSVVGVEQARCLGTRLAETRFTHVFSSDLDRAYQTAANILSSNNYPSNDIVTDTLLRERKFGEAEGRVRKELLESLNTQGLTLQDYVPKGAETTHEVFQRAVKFFENLCKDIQASVNISNNDQLNEYNVMETLSKLTDEQEDVHLALNQINLTGQKLQSSTDEDLNAELLSLSYNSLDELPNVSRVNSNANVKNTGDELTSVSRNTETPSSGYFGDDTTSSPFEDLQIPDVLVVSHGALLREMLKYFVYDLRCEIPHNHSILKQVPTNTALCKFTVQISSNENELPKLTCHLFHDKEHLNHANLESRTLCNM